MLKIDTGVRHGGPVPAGVNPDFVQALDELLDAHQIIPISGAKQFEEKRLHFLMRFGRSQARSAALEDPDDIATEPSGLMRPDWSDPCGCRTCLRVRNATVRIGNESVPVELTRMILCPTCGNKRCPHANDHHNACSGSNEPGQPGSAYP